MVAGVVETIRPAAEAKGITVALALNPARCRSTVTASGCAGRLANLLSNAVKFTPTGGRVRVELTMAGDRARLAVLDTGKGISGNFLPHVFERFRQADASSTRAEAGLGLGLAIVRHIVELHGGSVRADSAGEGTGATFTVDLPIAALAADGPVDAVGLGDITAETIDLDGVRVLIVDDHADSRDLFATVLSRRGAEVTAVDSVREGLAAARRVRPDVIVCDLAMPGDDGFALIREIRSRPGDQGSVVPAVALTAYARPEDRERALAAGFQVHLSKPVEPRALLEAVARVAVGGARDGDALRGDA